MTDNYAALRGALAAGPTPGPWLVKNGVVPDGSNLQVAWPTSALDTYYIAAASPDVIARLLAERDAAFAALFQAQEAAKSLLAERDRLAAALREICEIYDREDAATVATERGRIMRQMYEIAALAAIDAVGKGPT